MCFAQTSGQIENMFKIVHGFKAVQKTDSKLTSVLSELKPSQSGRWGALGRWPSSSLSSSSWGRCMAPEHSMTTLLHRDVNPAVPVLWIFCLISFMVTWM